METLVTNKTAQFAKEKGFNIPCWNFFDIYGEQNEVINFIGDGFEEKLGSVDDRVDYFIPSQSFLQKWLREEYNIDVLINRTLSGAYIVIIWFENKQLPYRKRTYNYEEALEEGLFEALNLVPSI